MKTKKRKMSKFERRQRRLMELSKSQYSGSVSVLEGAVETVKTSEIPKAKNFVNSSFHELPIKEIRKDMLKNFLYLAFAVAVIVGIKISGIDVSKLLSLRL